MDAKTIINYFLARNESTIDEITQLVEIESPSFDENGSRAAADWVSRKLESLKCGINVERIAIEGFGEHVYAQMFADPSKTPILLLGHSDTVHPLGSVSRNPTRIENGRLYGCGTFDMKANIVVIIEALRAFEHFGLTPSRPVNLLISCDEEVGSETGRPLVEREARKCEYCLVFEPSLDGKVKTGRKGTGGYVLKTHGIPSHAGLDPEKGASAILEMSRQIVSLQDLNDFESGTTVTIGTVKGGTTTNVVPAEAECSVDVRFETLEEAERIKQAINNLVPFDERVTIEIAGDLNRPPMEKTEGVVRLFEKARAIAAEFDVELKDAKVGGASDGNFVGALGVPLLDGLGIRGNGAHTLDEYVEVDDIPFRAALLSKLLLED